MHGSMYIKKRNAVSEKRPEDEIIQKSEGKRELEMPDKEREMSERATDD